MSCPSQKVQIDALVQQIPDATRQVADPSNVLTLVQVPLIEGLSDDTEAATLNNIQSLVDSSQPPAGVKVTVSGSLVVHRPDESSDGIPDGDPDWCRHDPDGYRHGPALLLREYRFLPVVFVGLGLSTALGLMGLAGIQLNMAVMGAFPVMIGLGIDYAIQFHARLDEESRKGSLDDAVYMTITRTARR